MKRVSVVVLLILMHTEYSRNAPTLVSQEDVESSATVNRADGGREIPPLVSSPDQLLLLRLQHGWEYVARDKRSDSVGDTSEVYEDDEEETSETEYDEEDEGTNHCCSQKDNGINMRGNHISHNNESKSNDSDTSDEKTSKPNFFSSDPKFDYSLKDVLYFDDDDDVIYLPEKKEKKKKTKKTKRQISEEDGSYIENNETEEEVKMKKIYAGHENVENWSSSFFEDVGTMRNEGESDYDSSDEDDDLKEIKKQTIKSESEQEAVSEENKTEKIYEITGKNHRDNSDDKEWSLSFSGDDDKKRNGEDNEEAEHVSFVEESNGKEKKKKHKSKNENEDKDVPKDLEEKDDHEERENNHSDNNDDEEWILRFSEDDEAKRNKEGIDDREHVSSAEENDKKVKKKKQKSRNDGEEKDISEVVRTTKNHEEKENNHSDKKDDEEGSFSFLEDDKAKKNEEPDFVSSVEENDKKKINKPKPKDEGGHISKKKRNRKGQKHKASKKGGNIHQEDLQAEEIIIHNVYAPRNKLANDRNGRNAMTHHFLSVPMDEENGGDTAKDFIPEITIRGGYQDAISPHGSLNRHKENGRFASVDKEKQTFLRRKNLKTGNTEREGEEKEPNLLMMRQEVSPPFSEDPSVVTISTTRELESRPEVTNPLIKLPTMKPPPRGILPECLKQRHSARMSQELFKLPQEHTSHVY